MLFLFILGGYPPYNVYFSDIITPFINLVVTVLLFYVAFSFRDSKNEIYLAWMFLAFAQLSFVIGDTLWGFFEITSGTTGISLADFFYMFYYFLFIMGLIFLSSTTLEKNSRFKTLIEMLIVIISTALIFVTLLIIPLIKTANGYSPEFMLSLYYVFLDFFLFVTLINLIFRIWRPNDQTTLILLSAGIFIQVVTDFFYTFYTINGNFMSGGPIDVGWIIGYIFIGLAALSQINGYRINFKKYMPNLFYCFRKVNWKLYSLLIFAILSYVTLLWSFKNLSEEYIYLLEYGVGAIIFLVIVRQVIESRENESLYLAANDEINKRRIIENKLQRNEKKYRAIVENANEGIISTDLDGRMVFVNNRLMEMVEYKEEELIGKHVLFLMDDGSVESAKSCMINVKNGKKGQNEFRFRKKDGKYIDVLINVSPVIDNGKYSGCLALISNISESKAAQKQIKQSLNEKEVLLREIHHRVKNNMQIISSMLSLQSNYIKDKKTRDLFLESQNRVKSMALVHEKLYRSKKISEISFTEYLKDIVYYLLNSYSLNQGVHFNIDTEDISFNMDTAVPLCLIINELVTNSLKYAFKGYISYNAINEVNIVIKPKNGKYEMIVSDNGKGLPDNFDIFNNGSLGLNIVNVLVKQLNGTMEILDTPGTTYRILFEKAA